ncbi:MAG: hypothetical protein JO079_08175 [Frankiaceae bacterium]|nr:hypothetical protein [Frankiaceae bacterium]MBV9369485.1 hypothetical protein [Frankiales bacterium]
MARHAATKTRRRSSSAERAHSAGLVTYTIDLAAPTAVRDRLVNTAARNGKALGVVAAAVWIYDFARIARGA